MAISYNFPCQHLLCILTEFILGVVTKSFICLGFFLTALPYARFKENGNTALVTTTYGGHFGFLEGILPFGMTWMDRAVRQSLCALKAH